MNYIFGFINDYYEHSFYKRKWYLPIYYIKTQMVSLKC